MDDTNKTATPAVSTINPKADPDEYRQEQSQDEDDPDGTVPMEIDDALRKTAQAPNLPKDEMDTEEVDQPIKRVLDSTGDENQAEEDIL